MSKLMLTRCVRSLKLELEPTVLLDPKHENGRKLRKRFQFMGLSFREGII